MKKFSLVKQSTTKITVTELHNLFSNTPQHCPSLTRIVGHFLHISFSQVARDMVQYGNYGTGAFNVVLDMDEMSKLSEASITRSASRTIWLECSENLILYLYS